jgi:hypothetical protein
MRKRHRNEAQLSLFDQSEPQAEPRSKPQSEGRFIPPDTQEPTVLEFIRARFEHGSDMTPEEYKRWIKILVNHSLKRL